MEGDLNLNISSGVFEFRENASPDFDGTLSEQTYRR